MQGNQKKGKRCAMDLISRKEAIDAIYRATSDGYKADFCANLIKRIPTIEPPYKFDEWCTDCKEYDQDRHCCPRFNRVIMETVEEVRANFAPKTGRWEEEPNCWYRCSECGEHYPSIKGHMDYNYCPNCGADMRGEI